MKCTLQCVDTSRNNSIVFVRDFDSEQLACKAARRDFKLKSRQFGAPDQLPHFKDWAKDADGTLTADSGMFLIYTIAPEKELVELTN